MAPQWNRFDPDASSRLSRIWVERLVQPELVRRYRRTWPPRKSAVAAYGSTSQT